MSRGALLLVAGIAIWCGCGGDTRTAIVVYSPHGKEMLVELERRYESAHPDHDVRWLDMGAQDAYDRIRTERSNPQADIWFGGPMTVFARAETEGLLEPFTPSWDSLVASPHKSRTASWYGPSITPEVIMYNTRLLSAKDVPQDWDDLLDPRWGGKIIIRSPMASGTMRIMFSAMIARQVSLGRGTSAGFEWLRKLDANTRTYVADPTQLYLRIAREEAPLTVWNLPDVQIQVSTNNYPFGFVIPQSGTPLVTDCIALVKGGKHLDAAKGFYEFVTAADMVLLQAEKFARIPTRRDITVERLPHWMGSLDLRPLNVDWELVGAQEQAWMRYWDEHVKGSGRRPDGGG